MEAITRLEKSGLSLAQIAAASKVGAHAVRRWKRNECAPNSSTRDLLVALAETRGITLLAADFAIQRDSQAA